MSLEDRCPCGGYYVDIEDVWDVQREEWGVRIVCVLCGNPQPPSVPTAQRTVYQPPTAEPWYDRKVTVPWMLLTAVVVIPIFYLILAAALRP